VELDLFSLKKRCVPVGNARVAYYEEGAGEPVVLLHGCPFSSYIWRKVIPRLSGAFRCLAPDLLGLGDTETLPDADWSLRAQAAMLVGFLDALGIERAHLVGHDHGGAIAQLLASEHPQRIDRLVLTNVEAFDNWPSAEEKPFIVATQLPLLGAAVLRLWSLPVTLRLVLAAGSAVKDTRVLTPELIHGYVRANMGDGHRRAKLRRFLAGQVDPRNHRVTLDLLGGLQRFDRPTMIVWGQADPHFGPQWAERLYQEIPGATRLELLPNVGHLLMEEQPERLASLLLDFFSWSDREASVRPEHHRHG
jgi:pimeloyl-ACP methyl ester carboxylesterase